MSDNQETDVKTSIELGASTQPEEIKQDLTGDDEDSMDAAYTKTVDSYAGDTKPDIKNERSTRVLLPVDEGETYDSNGEEEEPKKKIFTKAELIIYLLFLVVFVTMAVLSRGNGDLSYTQTRAIRDPMMKDFFKPWNYDSEKDFVGSTTIADIYSFLTTVAIPLVMNDERNGTIFVQSQQILLGGIRMRQSRLQTETCVKDVFADMNCYSTEELTANSITFDTTTFNYATDDDLDDQSWRAKFGSYPGGGYYVDMFSDPAKHNASTASANAIAIINELESIKWIDAATKFVVIDFTTYNPSSTLHTVVRIGWELPSGGVFGTDELKTWKFERYTQSSGIALLVLHIVFLIMLVVMAVNVIRQMYKEKCWKCGRDENGKKYYWQVTKWRYLDFLNMVFFYIAFIMVVYNQSAVNNMDVYNTHEYVSFRKLQYSFTVESYVTALTSVLLCFRVFKYIGVNKRLQFLFLIFRTAGYDLVMFCCVLGVFFMTWGLAGFLTFNSDVDDFRSLSFSLFNMLRYTVAEMDYEALNLASPAWGSFFYFSWSLLMLLILINVFIAIINDAYTEVQEELADVGRVEFSMVGMFSKFKSFLGGGKLEDFDADGDGIVDLNEFMQHTKCTKEEADEFFAKYDVDGSGGLSRDEFDAAKKELEKHRAEEKAAKSQRRVAGRKNVGGGAGGNVPLEEWNELKSLLVAVLETSKAGRKTLQKQRRDSIHSPR